jgi:hypothetical protein
MFTNITMQEIEKIIETILTSLDLIPYIFFQELQKLFETNLTQNYLQFNHNQYKQINDLAMGPTTSHLFAEIFIHYLEY